ncbi:hypothetical protein ACOMHN_026481 [Nucella lapillus]
MAKYQPQAGGNAAPEAVWIPFIRDLYPNLLSQTHFLPPLFFYRTPQTVDTLAGQTVLVRDNPPASGHRRQAPSSTPAKVAGSVYLENPSDLQPVCRQDSDHQDDNAQQSCLRALADLPEQVMMVVSSLSFKKYLSNHTNPLDTAAISQLPSVQSQSVPPQVADGECDIVIIHRVYGLIIGEIKSVGGNDFFRQQSHEDQIQILSKQIRKAAQQLNNQETALRHLVSDLPPVRITKTLLLPNIASGLLQSALSASQLLLQLLCQTLSLSADVSLAVGLCLCQQELEQPLTWWQTLHTAGPDRYMTDDMYERLVARFCGPATTVDIPTPSPPRKVVRSFGQAVAETGLRCSSLSLTPTQVTLLSRDPEPQYMFLQGPPGTGKTVLLLLKALQWSRQGRRVDIVNGDWKSLAVSMLLEAQLKSSLGSGGGEGGLGGGGGEVVTAKAATTSAAATTTTAAATTTAATTTTTATTTAAAATTAAAKTTTTTATTAVAATTTTAAATTTTAETTTLTAAAIATTAATTTAATTIAARTTLTATKTTTAAATTIAASSSSIHRHCYDFRAHGFDVKAAVASLQQKIGHSGPSLVLFDEVDNGFREEFLLWLTELHAQVPTVSVWAAGVFRLDRNLTHLMPSWLEVQTLQEALRCPPVVTSQLQKATAIKLSYVYPYSSPQCPVPTQGPPVKRLLHTGEPDHSEDSPWQCLACSDEVARIINKELRVGQPDHCLHYRDVWIQYSGSVPSDHDILVRRLRQHYDLPVGVVTTRLPREDNPQGLAMLRELALAVTDQVMVTHWTSVSGLERRVVIAIGKEMFSRALHSHSRSSSYLYVIT